MKNLVVKNTVEAADTGMLRLLDMLRYILACSADSVDGVGWDTWPNSRSSPL